MDARKNLFYTKFMQLQVATSNAFIFLLYKVYVKEIHNSNS